MFLLWLIVCFSSFHYTIDMASLTHPIIRCCFTVTAKINPCFSFHCLKWNFWFWRFRISRNQVDLVLLRGSEPRRSEFHHVRVEVLAGLIFCSCRWNEDRMLNDGRLFIAAHSSNSGFKKIIKIVNYWSEAEWLKMMKPEIKSTERREEDDNDGWFLLRHHVATVIWRSIPDKYINVDIKIYKKCGIKYMNK